MSRLNLHMRPYELFDPSKRAHRELFAEFQRTMSWAHSPVLFVIEEEGEQIPVMKRKLLEYYQGKEFTSI